MINKTSLKFVAGFALIVVLAFGSIYYLNYYNSPEQKALRYYADLEKQYAEDTYGGKTPEETLQLFVDALKAGDIDLASKYFVVEKQTESLNKIQKIIDAGNLEKMITDVSKFRNGRELFEDNYQFVVLKDGTNEALFTIGLVKNTLANIWKIDRLFP